MIVDITAAAGADFEAIGDDIARDNPTRAASLVREIYQLCLAIADMPDAWPVVPRYERHGIRRWSVSDLLPHQRLPDHDSPPS